MTHSDLIERARVAQHSILPQPELIKELADEIERLRAELAEIRATAHEGVADIDTVLSALGVATTQTDVDPTRRWQAHMKVVEFLQHLRSLALSSTEGNRT